MFFEIIVTLTVSLAAILAFRQVDKKDRSFEKIKNYTDKVRSDFDGYFQMNEDKLQNSINDLETAQKTAAAAVKRYTAISGEIEAKEAEYRARAANLDEINAQIDKFSSMLNDLLEMSANAEENLLRLQTESRFIDKTSKKIQTQKEQLDSIEARIPTLLADFEKTDSEKLEACTAGLKSHIQEQAQYLAETAEQAVRQNEELLAQVRKSCEDALAAASDKAGSMENDVFQKMAAASEARLNRYNQEISAAIEAFAKKAGEGLEASKTETSSTLEAHAADVKARISTLQDDMQAQLASLSGETAQRISAVREETEQSVSAVRNDAQKGIDAVRSEAAKSIADVREETAKDIAAVRNDAESGIAAARDETAKGIDAVRNEAADGISSARDEVTKNIAEIRDEAAKAVADVKDETNREIAAFSGESSKNFTSAREEAAKNIASFRDEMAGNVAAARDEAAQSLAAARDDAEKNVTAIRKELTASLNERLSSSIASVEADVTARLADIEGVVTEKIKSLETDAANLTGVLSEQFHKKTDDMNRELSASFTEKLAAAESSITAFKQSFDSESSSVLDYARKELNRMAAEQKADVEALEKGRTDFSSEFAALKEKIASATTDYQEKQEKYFSDMDKQLEQCKNDVLYRFERLNTSNEEIKGLEQALREAIAAARQRADSDFTRFTQGQLERQATFETDIAGRNDVLSTRLHGLEGELNDLKEKAYGSVSEKLKVFEDEFFTDLSKRSSAMEDSMVQWQRDVNGKLNELSNQYEDARRSTEERCNEQLKTDLSAIQERLKEQVARLEDLIKNSEQTLQDRINNTEYGFRAYIEQQRVELDNAKNSAQEYLKNELTAYNTQADEILKRYEREINGQLEQIAQDVGASKEKTEGQVQAILTDFSSWSDRLNSQFEDTKVLFNEKLSSLDQNASDLISQVQQSFSTDIADFNRKIAEDQSTISGKFDDVKKEMQTAVSNYQEQSKSVLDDLKRNFDEMQAQIQHTIGEANTDSEQKLRALKEMVQDIRTRTDDTQDKLLGKIQTDANALNLKLDAVDKRLKEYIAQTQIIDKIEDHKVKLEEQLSQLRGEITRFDNFKQTAADVEQQITKIRKAEEDISQNAQKFMAEKKRMDLMEADFHKLMTLSSTMDQKITELQNSSDDLQLIQADIRRFQDSITDLTGKYDRLDKKAPVLDQTITDVDKTFETLQSLEKRLENCDSRAAQFPDRLDSLQSNVQKLLEAGPKISDAVTKLASLDSIIKTAEERMADLSSKNDWLVRTENRLQDISKKADNQLDLLKNVSAKAESGPSSAVGAPPLQVRENVIALAHKGWNVTQIANSLKLTQSEVELILDYFENNGK